MERRRGLGNRGSSRSRAGVENIEASDPNIKKQQKARVRKGEGNQHTQDSLEHRGPPLSKVEAYFSCNRAQFATEILVSSKSQGEPSPRVSRLLVMAASLRDDIRPLQPLTA